MLDRRQGTRNKVIYAGVAAVQAPGQDPQAGVDCVIRNISEGGACVELQRPMKMPAELKLTIPRKRHSFIARLIWREANKIGLAFRVMTEDAPTSDLDERLRRSERKKRELQRRVKQLLGEG